MDTVLTDVMGASLLAIDRVGSSLQNDETDDQDNSTSTDSSDPTTDNQNRLKWDNLQNSAKYASVSDKNYSLGDSEKFEIQEDIGEIGKGVTIGEEYNSGLWEPSGKPTNVTLPENGAMSFINGNNGDRRYVKQDSEFNSEETKGINKLTFVANPDKRIKKSKENLERSRIHNGEEEFSLFEQQLQLLEKETTDKCYKLKFKNWKEKPKKVQNFEKNRKHKSKVSDQILSNQLSSFEDRTVSRHKHNQHNQHHQHQHRHNHHHHHFHKHNKLKSSQSKSHYRKHDFKKHRSDSYSDTNSVADIDVSVPFNILSDICQTNTHPDTNKLKPLEIANQLESELSVARKPECEVRGVEEDNDQSRNATDKFPINYNRCYRLQSAQWECSTKCALRLLKRKYRSVRHSFAKEPVILLKKLSLDGYKMIGDNFEVISMWEAETDSSVCTEDANEETEKDELEDGVNLVDPRVMSLSRTLQSGQNGKVGAEKTFRNLSSKHTEAKTKVCFKLQAVKNTNIIKKPVIQKPDWSVLKQKLKEVNDKQILQKKKDAENAGKDVNRFVKSKQNPFHDITGDHRKPEGKWESNKSDIIDESVIQERKRELEKLCARSQTDNEDMTVKQVESDTSTISNKLEEIQEMLSDSDVELDSDFKLDGYSIEICQHSTDDDQSKEPSVDRDFAVKDIKTEHMEGLNRDLVNTPLRVTSGIIPNLYMSDDIKNLQIDERSLSPPVLVRESDEMSIVKAEIMLDQYRYIIREESDINNEKCDENVDNNTHLDNSTIVEDESKSETMEICAEENVPSDSVNKKSEDTSAKSESDMNALEVKTLSSGENAQNLSSQSADSKQKSNSADPSTQELSKSNASSHIEPSTSTSYEAGTDILQSHSASTSSESGTQVLQSNMSFSLNDAALSDSAETLNYSDLIDEMTSQNSDNPYDTDTDTELEIVEEEDKLSLEKEHIDLNKKAVDSNSIRSWRNRSITPSSSSDNESVISDYKTSNTQTIDHKTETSAIDNQKAIKTLKKFCIKNSNKDNDCDQNEDNEPVSQSGTMRTKLQEMDIKQNTAGSRQDGVERSALARQSIGSEEREKPGKLSKKRKQISNEKNYMYNQQELDDLPRISPPKRRQRPYSVGGSMPTKDLTQERLMHDLPNHNWLFNKYSSLSRERAAISSRLQMERNGADASSHVTMVDKVPSNHLSQRTSPSKTSIPVNRFLSAPATIPETFSAERSRQSITQSITQYVGHVEREDKGQYQGQPKMTDGGFKADKINLHYVEDSAIQPEHSMGKTVKHVDVKNDDKIMNQTASNPPLSTHLSKMIEDKYRDLTQKVNLTKNIGEFAETTRDNSDAMEVLGNASANQIKAIGDRNCDKELTEATKIDCETKVGKDVENKTEFNRKGAAAEENTTETRLERADGNASFDKNADRSITEKKIDKGSKKEEMECTTLDVDRKETCTSQKAVTPKEQISSKSMNLPTTPSNVVVSGGTKQQGADDPCTINVRQKPSPPVLRVQPRLYKPPSSQHAPSPVFGGSSNAERYTRQAERHTTHMPGDSLDTLRTRDTMDTIGQDASGHSNMPDHSGIRTTTHTSTDVRVPSRLSSAQPVQSADPLPVTSVLTPASQNRNINTGMVNAVQPFIQTTTLSSHGRHTHEHSRQSPERSRQIQESARQNQESARQTLEHSSNIPVSTSSVSHNSPHSSNNTQLLIPRAVVPINASANVVLNQTPTNQSQGNHQEQALIRLQTSPQVFEINPVTPGNQVILVNNTSSVIPINTISSRNTQTLGPQVLNTVETTQEQHQYGQILSSSQIIIAQPLDTRISDSSGGMVENLSRLNTVNKISHTVNTQHHTGGNESGPVTVGTDRRDVVTEGGTNTGEQGSASDDDEDFRRQIEEIENEIKRKQREQDEIRRKKMELLEKRKAAKSGVKVKTEDAEKEKIKDEMDSAEIPDTINVYSINSENEASNEHTLNNESVDSDVTETSTHHYEPNNSQLNAGEENIQNDSRRNSMTNNDINITSTEQNSVSHMELKKKNPEETIGTNTDTKTSSSDNVTVIGDDIQNDLSNNTATNTKTQMTTPSLASHAQMETRKMDKTETVENEKVRNNYNVDIEDEEDQFEGALVIDLSATSKEYGTLNDSKTRDLSSVHKSTEKQIKSEEVNTIHTSDEHDLDNKKEIKDANECASSSSDESRKDEQPFQNKNEIISDNSIQYIEDIGRVNPFTGEYEYFDDNEAYNESLDLTNKSKKDKASVDKVNEGDIDLASESDQENKPEETTSRVSTDDYKFFDVSSENSNNTQLVDGSNKNIFSDVQNQSNNFNDPVNHTGNDDVNGLDLSSKPICVFTFKKEDESCENQGQTSNTGNNDGKGNSDQSFTSHTDISDTSQHDKVTNSSMETSQNRNIRRNSRKYSEESSIITQTVASAALSALNPKGIKQEVEEPIVDKSPEAQVESDNMRSVSGMQNVSQSDSLTTSSEVTSYESRMLVNTVNQRSQNDSLNTSQTVKTEPKQMDTEQSMDLSMNINRQTVPASSVVTSTSAAVIPTQSSVHMSTCVSQSVVYSTVHGKTSVSSSSPLTTSPTGNTARKPYREIRCKPPPPDNVSLVTQNNQGSSGVNVQQQQRQLQTPPHSIRQALQVSPAANNRNPDQESVSKQRQRSMDMAGVLPFQCGTSAFESERRNPMARGWRPYPGAQQPQRRTRGMYIELEPAHTKPRQKKIPRNAKPSQAHSHVINMKEVFKKMNKSQCRVPTTIQQSSPYFKRKVPVHQSAEDILITEEKMKNDERTIKPAHCQKPFSIAGQLIVSKKRGYKRSVSRMTISPSPTRFSSVPNTPPSTPEEIQRSSSAMADIPVRHDNSIDASLPSQRSNSLEPSCPARAHAALDSHGDNNNFSTLQVLKPPTSCNIRDRRRSSTSDCSGVIDLTRLESPKLEIVDEPTPTQVSHVNKETEVQNELTAALAKRQRLDPSIQEPARNSSRNSRGGIQSPNDRDSNVNNPINTQMSPQIQSSDIRMQKPVMRAPPTQPLRHPGYSRYRQVLCPVPTDRSHRPEVGPYPLLNQDIHAQSTQPHGVHRQGEPVNEHIIQRMEMASNEYYRQRIDNRIKEREQQRFENRTNDNFAQQMDNRSMDPKTQRMDANQMHSANRNTFDRIAQRMELTQTQPMDRSLHDRVTQRMDNRMSDRTLAQHLDNPSRDRLHQSINQQQQQQPPRLIQPSNRQFHNTADMPYGPHTSSNLERMGNRAPSQRQEMMNMSDPAFSHAPGMYPPVRQGLERMQLHAQRTIQGIERARQEYASVEMRRQQQNSILNQQFMTGQQESMQNQQNMSSHHNTMQNQQNMSGQNPNITAHLHGMQGQQHQNMSGHNRNMSGPHGDAVHGPGQLKDLVQQNSNRQMLMQQSMQSNRVDPTPNWTQLQKMQQIRANHIRNRQMQQNPQINREPLARHGNPGMGQVSPQEHFDQVQAGWQAGFPPHTAPPHTALPSQTGNFQNIEQALRRQPHFQRPHMQQQVPGMHASFRARHPGDLIGARQVAPPTGKFHPTGSQETQFISTNNPMVTNNHHNQIIQSNHNRLQAPPSHHQATPTYHQAQHLHQQVTPTHQQAPLTHQQAPPMHQHTQIETGLHNQGHVNQMHQTPPTRTIEGPIGQEQPIRKKSPKMSSGQMSAFSPSTSSTSHFQDHTGQGQMTDTSTQSGHQGLTQIHAPMRLKVDISPDQAAQSDEESMPHLQQVHGTCVLCGKYSLYLCSSCKKIWYCSPECQLTHWQTHVNDCKGPDG